MAGRGALEEGKELGEDDARRSTLASFGYTRPDRPLVVTTRERSTLWQTSERSVQAQP
jgi:hypothetical protein